VAVDKVTVNNQAEYDAEVIAQRAKSPDPFYVKKTKTQDDGLFPWDVTFTDTLKNKQPQTSAETAYAELSAVAPGSTQSNINNSYRKIDQFDTVGEENGVTARLQQNEFSIDKEGVYIISFYLSYSGESNQIFSIAIHVNDVEVSRTVTDRTISASNDIGSVSKEVLAFLQKNDKVDVRVKTALAGNHDFTVQKGNFIVKKRT
jgi:hypothetical protein